MNYDQFRTTLDLSYWKRRCKAAEEFIENSPRDLVMHQAQRNAHKRWKDLVKAKPKGLDR